MQNVGIMRPLRAIHCIILRYTNAVLGGRPTVQRFFATAEPKTHALPQRPEFEKSNFETNGGSIMGAPRW